MIGKNTVVVVVKKKKIIFIPKFQYSKHLRVDGGMEIKWVKTQRYAVLHLLTQSSSLKLFVQPALSFLKTGILEFLGRKWCFLV
jgi:hypothetical protein